MNSDTEGSFSLGFSTNVLPQARALANIHIGTIAGKLNGVIPATTPSGWRIEYTSMPVAACSE
jgi:allophanate hydrolase subunit 1